MEYAHVYPNIKEIRMQDVVQSVSLTTTVLVIKLAFAINALIPVLELVERMQFVKFKTMFQYVHALWE